MDRFRALHVFVAVADLEGFARAAVSLRMSPTVVTRMVAALENQVGTRLLARTTRKVRLTEAGALFAASARKILADLAEAEAAVSDAAQAIRGRIRLTSPVLFGRYHVAPVVLDFMRRYPEITVELLLVDGMTDLLQENIDIAVRIAKLTDASLTAVPVGRVGRVLCASADYLARHGQPRTLSELATLDGIELASASARQWTFRRDGADRTVRPRILLSANSPDVVVAACVRGMGLARFMRYQVKSEMAAGKLLPVLSEYEPPPQPVNLVYPSQRRVPRRVRVLLDHMKSAIRERDI